jgi:predicted esterase
MTRRVVLAILLIGVMWPRPALARVQNDPAPDPQLRRYLEAPDVDGRNAAIDAILKARPDFDVLYSALQKGRVYASDVPTGKILRTHKVDGVNHPYLIYVPLDYDPANRYPVMWNLHGGMGQPEWTQLDGSWNGWGAVKEEDFHQNYIVVAPAGWWDSMWWENSQVENFKFIMNEVKRTWNIHENRVFMMGSSDGAIAEWFYAFRYPDPWVFYAGYSGFPARLTNTFLRADGQMHLSNLEGQRFHVVNGGRDLIVNIDVMRGYMDVFKSIDVQIDYFEHPNDGHDLTLSQEEQAAPFHLVNQLRRDPLPDSLSWSTERVDRYNRHHWLVIDELAADHVVDETNILPRIHGKNVDNSPPFPSKPWGRVRLERAGNHVRATTVGVTKFRLLLSPEEFDFSRPIHIDVNDGEVVYTSMVSRDTRTLLKWNAIDDDRLVLFAAEIEIQLPE